MQNVFEYLILFVQKMFSIIAESSVIYPKRFKNNVSKALEYWEKTPVFAHALFAKKYKNSWIIVAIYKITIRFFHLVVLQPMLLISWS